MAFTSSHNVCLSSNPIPRWNYDVFLSFRGEDTRKNFVDHLFAALSQRGIDTFKDDEQLRRGEEISPALLKAIEDSRFALIVFSKHYASSRWCLDELVKIVECKKTMGQTVVPVFYDVDPSEVRKQTGIFGSAFEIHEKDFGGNMEKVQRWKTALVEAANISGYSVPDTAIGHESKCIVQIVEEIFNILNNTCPHVAQDLVGTESRVEKLESLLCERLDEVRFIGIWGMGGIGKTTAAKAVYDRIYHQFEGSCFLTNVREVSERQGLEALQKQLLSEILIGSNIKITDTVRGANIIKSRLSFKRVLIVLDDVDKQKQLDAIAGEHGWFGVGSRIIITTRDKHLLTAHGVNECHTVGELNKDEAIQLLSWKAFKQSFPSEGYLELSNRIVDYAGGLPLALKILGSFLYGRTTDEWKSALIKLHRIPNKDILQVLKISFDGLDEMEKEIFLDIACFFKGKHQCFVTRILDSCGFCPGIRIPVLIEKSLITISKDQFWMHDLIQEMGCYIVRQESQESRKCSRLWLQEDVCYVLTENTGTEKIEAICLELPEPKVFDLNSEAFTKMKKLRLFKVHNVVFSKGPAYLPNELRLLDWHAYPSDCLPASFQAENLVELRMCYSSIKQLWKKIKQPMAKLKVINLSHSHRLSRTPDFTVIPNLETLILEDCTSLVEVHPSVGVLDRLVVLSLKNCKNLKRFPNGIHLKSLETLILSGCLKLEKCPEILGDMVCLSELYLGRTSIKELPSSIERLTSLTLMDLSECNNLSTLPLTIRRLRCLKTLILSGCSKLEKFLEILVNMECLSELYLDRTTIKELPSSIEQLTSLTLMDLSECKYLTSLPGTICRLSCLKTLCVSGCSKLGELPEDLGNIKCLEELRANNTAIKRLPSSINHLEGLKVLSLGGCKGTVSFFSSWFLPRKCEDSVCLVLPSLAGLNSLTELDLSDCNLSEGGIPSDLGSLSSLKELNLSRNSFVSLPATISHLSQLESLELVGCKRLEALPELPSSIIKLIADDCPSLISSRDLFSNNTIPFATFSNCFKWSENVVDMLLRFLFQRQHVVYDIFTITLPGREIPEWFSQQNLGTSTYLQLPPDWCEERDMGIAVCGVYDFATPNQRLKMCFHLVDHNDKQYSQVQGYFWIPTSTNLGSKHIVLWYIPTQWMMHWNKNKRRQLGASFEFVDTKNGSRRLPARKWGARIVCEKDVKNWKDGYGNLGIMDGSDEAVAVEDKNISVKRKRDDSDEQSPCTKREHVLYISRTIYTESEVRSVPSTLQILHTIHKFVWYPMASTSTHTVSSSSNPNPKWNYELFLSFRGEDTRKNFVDHLFTALSQKGIYTFKDDEQLKRGEEISPALLKAIEESRFALIVFSRNYASSKWCLDELVKIVECKKTMGQTVVPVFYDVDPSEVRKQTGSFGSAFKIHERVFSGNMEKVQRWKSALVDAANISGYSVRDTANGHESKCIVQIVEEIFNELNNTTPLVAQDLVGTESRVEKMESLLREGLDEVRFIGIWGMGGIGKTTIAKAVYDRIYRQFEGSCFLSNVGEFSEKKGLEALQKRLLSEILIGSNINITDTVRGANIIISRLRFKRVLVVLDDVDKREQLNAVAGEHGWFGVGSRIIITTRDKHLLSTHGVNECHIVGALNKDEAMQLLSWKAFKQSFPSKGFMELSNQIVDYAGGLPLALTVLGSFLNGRTTDEWKSTLIKLHKISNNEILQVLKISFDGLDELEKEIFLDIACFFKGKHKCYVTRILDSCGFCPGIGIPVLVEKSLITITNDQFWMHDLIQEMGWYIVRQESQLSWKRSRLWLREDVYSVLTENMGTEKVEAIGLELPKPEVLDLNSEAFTKMKKLRVFKVHNVVFSKGPAHLPNELRLLDWHAYPSGFLPASFQAENLVELSMCYSSIKQLWKKTKPLTKLKVINLSHSHRLSRTPDFTVIPDLETLILEDCTSLVEVHPSIGHLKRLVFLSLKDCKNLKRFPNGIHLESLEKLILSGCLKLEKCPEILGDMVCLTELYLDRTAIKELPLSIEHLTGLTLMDLSECKYLMSLPRTICRLSCLKTLSLSGCSKLEELPDNLGNIKYLEELHANKTAIKQLPSSINLLEDLKVLSLSGCRQTISESFFSSWFLPRKCEDSLCLVLPSLTGLNSLTKLDVSDCNLSQGSIPSDLGSLSSLKELNLSRNNFVSLPATISELSQLKTLELVGCKRLEALPEIPSCIATLFADDCQSLISVGNLSTNNRSLYSVTFSNCLKLLENKLSENVWDMLLRFMFQRLCVVNSEFSIFLPGREIPELFSHQNLGTSSYLQLPPGWCSERCMGIAVCAVGDFATVNLATDMPEMVLCFTDRYNKQSTIGSGWFWIPTGTNLDSEHMLLNYLPNHLLRSESGGWNPNKWRQLEVYFEFGDQRLLAKKWGVHVVCEKDVKKWKDGCGNLGILDGSNEAVAVEDKNNTLKRKRDDSDDQILRAKSYFGQYSHS
ncbi:uncharacterized protein LOC132270059 [Cornus florida]|uniref:uncharacterized protein LOC132270059 n=1 Tax=Cornus florida TaxID=4283 RepID=UPI0028A21B5F|nr:uncharacterized protein LOC132270059 [Cornus florida]